MFGILRPATKHLDVTAQREYVAIYCNVCGHLRQMFGLKSRMLVVHDVATLAWLLMKPGELSPPLATANCLRGTGRTTYVLPPIWSFLAAISAHTAGIKIRDDVQDDGGIRERMVERVYSDVFVQAEKSLHVIGFPLEALQGSLLQQHQVESRREPSLALAAQATGDSFGLVASEIARIANLQVCAEEARSIGTSLGKIVYAVDASRDYEIDSTGNYNPLREQAGSSARTMPPWIRRQCQEFIVEQLETARAIVDHWHEDCQRRWDSLARRIVALAGFPGRDIVLQAACCFPCGDGAVACDTDDCGTWFCCGICGCICCSSVFS